MIAARLSFACGEVEVKPRGGVVAQRNKLLLSTSALGVRVLHGSPRRVP